MTSTLGCLGLAVPDEAALDALLTTVLDDSTIVGRPGAVETRRWLDAPSGALLTVVRQGETIVDLVPTFAGQVGAELANLVAHEGYAAADVRQDGELVTRICCDLPQGPYLPRVPIDFTDAAITALGVDVTVHADADAFAASEASVVGTPEPGEEPHRFAAESLIPYGLFGDSEAGPTAFMAGTVLVSETRTTSITGQRFHAMLLRTVGFTASLCLAAEDHPVRPEKGNVVAGSVYLVADVPELWKVQPRPKRSWLKRR